MKFTDGQWMLQPGVAAHYAAEAYAVEAHADRLVVLATTAPSSTVATRCKAPRSRSR
jgi:alpha-D-xyloside xylohydrolase